MKVDNAISDAGIEVIASDLTEMKIDNTKFVETVLLDYALVAIRLFVGKMLD